MGVYLITAKSPNISSFGLLSRLFRLAGAPCSQPQPVYLLYNSFSCLSRCSVTSSTYFTILKLPGYLRRTSLSGETLLATSPILDVYAQCAQEQLNEQLACLKHSIGRIATPSNTNRLCGDVALRPAYTL